jgi:WD40 repeat protein/uncharacterized caspase-like protein
MKSPAIGSRSCTAVGILLAVLFVGNARGQPKPGPARDPRPRLVARLGHASGITSVALAPDGKYLLTGSLDNTACLWDVATGKDIRRFQHADRVTAVAFTPEGKGVLTASGDSTARLWETATGKILRRFAGHEDGIAAAALSPDGTRLLTGCEDGTARLWDVAGGKVLRTFRGHGKAILAVAYGPGGRAVLTGGADGTARLWDPSTGKELHQFRGHAGPVAAVAFAPGGQRVVTGGQDKTARLWSVATGKEIGKLAGHTAPVVAVAFAPDGRRVLTGSEDATTRLWDAEAGKQVRKLPRHGDVVAAVAFAPDGRRLLSASHDCTARLWDAATGKELRRFKGQADWLMALALSPDGKRMVTGGWDIHGVAWDLTGGREARRLPHDEAITSVAFAGNSKVVTGSDDALARLWDLTTGKELRRFKGHTGSVTSVAVAGGGGRLLTGSEDRTARLWDLATGKELRRFSGHVKPVTAVAFAPDGQRVLTGSEDAGARLWDAASGKEARRLLGHEGEVYAVAFSPDGKHVLTGGEDGSARLWDPTSGKELRRFRGHDFAVVAVAFSPDGKHVLTASQDNSARLWDAATGRQLLHLRSHASPVRAAAFSADGRFVFTGSEDCTTRVWDRGTGHELCQVISFLDGSWAVVDPQARFDATRGGAIPGLHWVIKGEPVALDQLKERYYEPGLLAKRLGLNKEPLRNVVAFQDVKFYPSIAIDSKDARKPRFAVTLTNRGGGIGRVVVLVNGKELTGDARPRGAADANAARLEFPLDLAQDPRVVPGRKNTVEVLAYNADGYLCSRGMVREFDGPGPAAADPPTLQAVVAGVAKYRGEQLSLRYAAKDAEDFAAALRLAAGRLFDAEGKHPERVRVTLLCTTQAGADKQPTHANLVKALAALKTTKPGDVVVVYLAGHGVAHGGTEGDWYYLTADAQSAELSDPAVRKQVSLSSAELTDLLKATPAQKQVLILDTCHSGGVVDRLTEKRQVPGSQARALERVKDRTGMHVLAGCAADAVSYEASRYGQGLLTYSLLMGMRGARLREGQYVDVVDLFGFATDTVPELARDIGGVQRPTVASPRGGSFDIGRLTAQDQARVPLQSVKPVVLRSSPASFQLEKPARDSLGLSKKIDERLSEAAAARGARFVFVNADEYPGGVQPSGRYQVEGDKVTVNVSLFQGEKEVAKFTVTGAAGKPDDLAKQIAAEVEKQLAAGSGK